MMLRYLDTREVGMVYTVSYEDNTFVVDVKDNKIKKLEVMEQGRLVRCEFMIQQEGDDFIKFLVKEKILKEEKDV
jgi:hypothetical protein